MPTPELVERMARAACAEVESRNEIDYAELGCIDAADFVDKFWPNYVTQIQAALKAHEDWLAEQGLVVVPRVATKEMLDVHFNDHEKHFLHRPAAKWQAMISTALQQEE